jgi:transposase
MAKNSSRKVKKDDSYIAYKFQLLPNNKQAELICKTFGCCRKIWNLMLADREDYYAKYKKNFESYSCTI